MQISNEHQTAFLQNAISLLATSFTIEAVYLAPTLSADGSYRLIVILADKYHRILGEIVPKIRSKIREFKSIEPICFSLRHTRRRLSEGNIYLFDHCKAENRLYPSWDIPLEQEIPTLSECISKSHALWGQQFQRIGDFTEGYHYLKSRRKYSCAAFMLQQSMELTYKALEILLISKERISHSIRNHHNYLKNLTPLYIDLFDQQDEDDINLLETLIEIYQASRYEESYEVELETLERLELRMDKLHSNANYIFAQSVGARSKSKSSEQTLMSTLSDPALDNKQQGLSETITQQIYERIQGVIQVYQFGDQENKSDVRYPVLLTGSEEQAGNLNFLVITESDQRKYVFSLMAALKLKRQLTLQILNFTKHQVQHHLNCNNKFFHNVISDRKNFMLENSISWKLHPSLGVRSAEDAIAKRHLLKNRIANALAFLKTAKFLECPEQLPVKIYLLNQSLEHCCLGLLYSAIDLVPYSNKLNQLFLLCDSFWEFPMRVFPRNSKEENTMFQELVEARSRLRYRPSCDSPVSNLKTLEEKCARFIFECEILADTESFS